MLCRRQLTSSNDGVVSRIYVDGLVERECHVISVNGLVQGRVEVGDWCLRQTRQQLLGVTDTLSGRGGRPRTVTVPKL